MRRRELLASVVATALIPTMAKAVAISGNMPWSPGQASVPPLDAAPNTTLFFSPSEAETVGAIADRLIPADQLSVGGREAGCVRFIDRQLTGPYGKAASQYRLGRFIKGTPEQGLQSSLTPADRYRVGLAALNDYCQTKYGAAFPALGAQLQDEILSALERKEIGLGTIDGSEFFEQILQNVREGFLSDPIYGGNKDLASWNMLGFPGAYYDYRDMIDQKGKKLDLKPVSLFDPSL